MRYTIEKPYKKRKTQTSDAKLLYVARKKHDDETHQKLEQNGGWQGYRIQSLDMELAPAPVHRKFSCLFVFLLAVGNFCLISIIIIIKQSQLDKYFIRQPRHFPPLPTLFRCRIYRHTYTRKNLLLKTFLLESENCC